MNTIGLSIQDIRQNHALRSDFIRSFRALLEEHREFILEPLSEEHILNVFAQQGFWSGVRIRIFFDPTTGFHVARRDYENQKFD